MQGGKKLFTLVLVISAVSLSPSAPACAADRISFSPSKGVEAVLLINGPAVQLKLSGPEIDASDTIEVETEKKLKISVEDYNFDGHKDFSVSHLDDGMGTYQIYQVYLYSLKEKKFLPLTPKCGDEFINLVVNKTKRTLTNSYMVDNRYKTCQMKY
ncbi:hypothetical protein LJR289_005508 [Pseudoduganella sp. LjRoot289]|uniref:XAC2610-related protein n=1 Tax=Pseudoduganella sp. LjRoot289 TaxID=3342314 RepID=UPI003ECE5722